MTKEIEVIKIIEKEVQTPQIFQKSKISEIIIEKLNIYQEFYNEISKILKFTK